MADNTYQFVPEACDNHIEGNSVWTKFLRVLDPEKWYSVANSYYQLCDIGYKTYELAMDVIIKTTHDNKPQPVKILRVVIHDVNL